MTILRCKSFEELDLVERQGRGINYNFRPNREYYERALSFSVRRAGPAGVYRFKTFEEAEEQETTWVIQHATQ